VSFLKRIALALLFSLLLGIAIGTVLRIRMERPKIYIGSVAPRLPLAVGHARAPILDPGQHEQQIG
jgi:hypothetical protein